MRTQSQRNNDCTTDKYFYFLLGMNIAIALIFREDLFVRYFMLEGVICEGDIFFYIYWGLAILVSMWPIASLGKCKSKFHLAIAGVTPAIAVLIIRWSLAGFIIPKILIIMFIVYLLILVAQILSRVMRKQEVFMIILQAIYKSGFVLQVLSVVGVLGYLASGFAYAEPIVEFEKAVSSVDRGWEYNTDMLRMWKNEFYADLDDEEKKQLWQALIDMESNYWGIASPTVEIETYDFNSTREGYYNKEQNIISVRDSALGYPRERVLNILLHEVNHAYTRAIADSVDWKDIDDSDRQLRMYVDAYAYKEAEANYTQPEEDEEEYYSNALEIAARTYAEEWGPKYLQYIDAL